MKKLLYIVKHMNKKILILPIIILISVHYFFSIEYVGRPDVVITWSIAEEQPTSHTLTINDTSYPVAAGQSTTSKEQLYGGGNGSFLLTSRGWSIRDQKILVDGNLICRHNIRCYKKQGELEILGIARQPSMNAEISLHHCIICKGIQKPTDKDKDRD